MHHINNASFDSKISEHRTSYFAPKVMPVPYFRSLFFGAYFYWARPRRVSERPPPHPRILLAAEAETDARVGWLSS